MKQFAIGLPLFCIVAVGCANEKTKGSVHRNVCSFGQPQTLGPTINSPLFEGGPTVSSDQRTLIFTATRDPVSEQEDLFISYRQNPNVPWGTPEPLRSEVNSPTASLFTSCRHDPAGSVSLDASS
jgi:hypothetical protein